MYHPTTQPISPELQAELDRRCDEVNNMMSIGRIPHKYASFVQGLFKPMNNFVEGVHHAATGVAGEAGELLDASKKAWAYGKPYDVQNVLEECGDILFYLTATLGQFGFTINDAIMWNRYKLAERYPSGEYSDAQAIARADKVTERKFMRDDTKE